MNTALIVILVILGVLALAGVVFANGISVFFATFIFLGAALVIITLLSVFHDENGILENVDLFGKLRGSLVGRIHFSVGDTVQRVLILIMSAASVAIIVRAIIIAVNAFIEFSNTNNYDNLDWLIDMMDDVPVMNVIMLMKKSVETEFRPDFFVIVLLLSLVVMAIASAVVQVIMALINEVISDAKADSVLFRILGIFSVTTLTVAGTIFLSRLIGPLLDFSKPWDGFEDFCRPFLSSSVGNFLLQVLVTVVLFALLIFMCFDWVQSIVMGSMSMIVLFIFQILYTIIFKLFGTDVDMGSSVLWGSFTFLLFVLYPIIDFIINLKCEDDRTPILTLLPVAVPVGLSMLITLVSTVIGKTNPPADFFSNVMLQFISLFVFVVYLLVMPAIDIVRDSDE